MYNGGRDSSCVSHRPICQGSCVGDHRAQVRIWVDPHPEMDDLGLVRSELTSPMDSLIVPIKKPSPEKFSVCRDRIVHHKVLENWGFIGHLEGVHQISARPGFERANLLVQVHQHGRVPDLDHTPGPIASFVDNRQVQTVLHPSVARVA